MGKEIADLIPEQNIELYLDIYRALQAIDYCSLPTEFSKEIWGIRQFLMFHVIKERITPEQATQLLAQKFHELHLSDISYSSSLAPIARYHLVRRGSPKHGPNFLMFALAHDLTHITPRPQFIYEKVIEFFQEQDKPINNEPADLRKRIQGKTSDDVIKIIFYGSMVSDKLKKQFIDRHNSLEGLEYNGFGAQVISRLKQDTFSLANYESNIRRMVNFTAIFEYRSFIRIRCPAGTNLAEWNEKMTLYLPNSPSCVSKPF
jgi:hypothetical protein